ncbi:MAG: SufD family Fe-S cluster assembly protein [Clostridia bacterium]|nr:SufD family Fe-S cluster assembly protein [Clostridia bacterium]
MTNLLLNETPVRTSKNFNINNISVGNIEISNKLKEFNNVSVSELGSKVVVDNNYNEKFELKYGLNDELTKQVNDDANYKANIVIDSKTNQDVKVDFKFDKNNNELVDAINIVANEGTKSTVVIKYDSDDKTEAYHNGIIKAVGKSQASLNVIVVNFLNNKSTNFMTIENSLEDDAKIYYYIIDFGGKTSITNYYSNIKGKNADSKLNTLYIGTDEQLIDLNYIGELYGEKSNVNIEVQGALKDKARKHFKGTIDFKKGCKKATGDENENCILLSDTAKSLALPMLLCSEEDVEGNHSTSSGKIAEKELFYIMSRGFEKKEALKLMVRAKFNKIIDEIKDEDLKAEIIEQIDKRID